MKATAPVGRGPAGASPVLGAAPAALEPEVEPLAAGAPDLAPEPDGVCDAEADPDEVTTAYAEIKLIVDTSSLDITVVVVPRSDWSTTYPSAVATQVKSASAIAPCHLQFTSTVLSSQCMSHV
jgi:hypothetical protein